MERRQKRLRDIARIDPLMHRRCTNHDRQELWQLRDERAGVLHPTTGRRAPLDGFA